MRRFGWLFLLLVVCPCHAAAQGTQDEDRARAFFRELWTDQKQIWTTPFKGDTWHRKTPFVLVIASGASFALDDEPSRKLRDCQGFSRFNDIFASTASGAVLTAFPAAVWATGALAHRPGMTDYGVKATRAAIAGIGVTVALKAVTQRPRPAFRESLRLLGRRKLLSFRALGRRLGDCRRHLPALPGAPLGRLHCLSRGGDHRLLAGHLGQPLRLRCRHGLSPGLGHRIFWYPLA